MKENFDCYCIILTARFFRSSLRHFLILFTTSAPNCPPCRLMESSEICIQFISLRGENKERKISG